jgi:hypothetical protein
VLVRPCCFNNWIAKKILHLALKVHFRLEVEFLCRHQFSTAERRGAPSHILDEKPLPFIPHGGRKGDLEVLPGLKWEDKEERANIVGQGLEAEPPLETRAMVGCTRVLNIGPSLVVNLGGLELAE